MSIVCRRRRNAMVPKEDITSSNPF